MGHFQGVGALNLSYRGQRYHLKQGVVSFNLGGNSGVQQNNLEHPQQYADGVLHLNLEQGNEVEPMGECDRDEHIVGLIMAHQYSLKKGLELFGKKAEDATLKELK